MYNRADAIIDCISAVQSGDWIRFARLAEIDSIQLHGVTMSGSLDNKIFAWGPENITLFRMCNDLRSEGVPVCFSTDTGPTVVFLTHRDFEDAVVGRIHDLNAEYETVRGTMGGPVELLDPSVALEQLEN
jgi:mevalonate pyrophosphate decarboxylase